MMAGHTGGDGLGRWLVGGLVVGALALGLMVAAYAIGYSRGQSSSSSGTAAGPTSGGTSTTTTTTATTTPAAGVGAVALGKTLFESDGCSSCHSLDGSPSVGPTMKGLAGSKVTLDDGTTVTADDAYLTTSIDDPDAQIVKGHQKGVMSAAIAGFGLAGKPADVKALVAFIKAQR